MKKFLLATLFGIATFSATAANVGVGVSVNVGDPNFYGSIDIGNYPQPQFVNPAPIIIQPSVGVAISPLYLHVPVEHYSNWRRYCSYYNACARPVYFVHDNWYRQVYAPRYHNEHLIHREEVRHEDRRYEERRHEERRDEERRDERYDHRQDGEHR